MKVSKLKKALLVVGMGMSLSSVVFSAHARPSSEDCYFLDQKCNAGNQVSCTTVETHCWRYGY